MGRWWREEEVGGSGEKVRGNEERGMGKGGKESTTIHPSII